MPMRGFVNSAFLATTLLVSITSNAFQSSPPPSTPATGNPVVAKHVLKDGTIEFEYADGTKRQIPSKPPVNPSPAEATGANDGDTSDPMVPTMPPSWLKDPATNERFLKAMGSYYEYRSSGLENRKHVFEWQLFSSKIIFMTVLTLVAAGIVFAALQFWVGLKRKEADARDAASEIEWSAQGMKVSSPVLGVIILVISLAFFYLYLVYVYPISEIM